MLTNCRPNCKQPGKQATEHACASIKDRGAYKTLPDTYAFMPKRLSPAAKNTPPHSTSPHDTLPYASPILPKPTQLTPTQAGLGPPPCAINKSTTTHSTTCCITTSPDGLKRPTSGPRRDRRPLRRPASRRHATRHDTTRHARP